ncbi:hydroxyacid dehydrogenase [Piscinibacter sakaiensis]|uniref:hydroxyacid dehydrogenase n=1 Tax=Piscinibacter sakaiensis TaxID=1547922 RepID=UPI003AAD8ED2
MARIFLSFTPGARANYYGDKALAGLRALGEVRLNERDQPLDAAALAAAAEGCNVIVSDRATAAPAELFAACPQLAVFQRCAMDIRNIDVAAASAHGVLVTHASAGFITAVAEWVFGALIDVARGISSSVVDYRSGRSPPPVMGRELRGSTIGVIGYGQIGRRVCNLGLAFGMRVLVADPVARVDDAALTQTSLDELLAAADHVVCLAPALPSTENMLDSQRFSQMKPGAVFVNASRGNLVDEAALLDALDSGRLAGCALDVGRAPDQMPSPELARHPLVVATPHIGGLTPPAVEHQALETVAQLGELLRGGMPIGAVNAEHASRLQALRSR